MPVWATNLIAAIAPKLLDWLVINLGKLSVSTLKWFRELIEDRKDRAELKQAAKNFEVALDQFKVAEKESASKEELDLKKEAMHNAFRDFVKYRPSK